MVLDTNLLLQYIRTQTIPPADTILTVITVAELKSLALQNKWGKTRLQFLDWLISKYPTLNISVDMFDIYANIDAFSQGKHPQIQLDGSARNMGKNDLWIATIALFYEIELHTLDHDFQHLSAIGLGVIIH